MFNSYNLPVTQVSGSSITFYNIDTFKIGSNVNNAMHGVVVQHIRVAPLQTLELTPCQPHLHGRECRTYLYTYTTSTNIKDISLSAKKL